MKKEVYLEILEYICTSKSSNVFYIAKHNIINKIIFLLYHYYKLSKMTFTLEILNHFLSFRFF